MPFLCELRKNWNVIATATTDDWLGWLKGLEEQLKGISPADIDSLSIGVQPVRAGERPNAYQGLVVFSLADAMSDDGQVPPDLPLAAVKQYLDDALLVQLDNDEHGNPYGFSKVLLIADSLVPVEAKTSRPVDYGNVCLYFREQGFVPEAPCEYMGEGWTVITYPYPVDTAVRVRIRHSHDPMFVQAVSVSDVTLKPAK